MWVLDGGHLSWRPIIRRFGKSIEIANKTLIDQYCVI
jgi:hypothetical protein